MICSRRMMSAGAVLIGIAALTLATNVWAASYQALVESRDDSAAPFDVFLASFNSLNDVFSSNLGSPTGYTQIDVSPDYRISGLTHDPGGYRLLVQSRADTAAPYDVFLASFKTLDDLTQSNLGSPTGYTQIDVAPGYQIAGMAWDGTAYRVLVESRADDSAPFDVFLASFNTLDDLMNANLGSPTGYTQIDVAPGYQIVGFTATEDVSSAAPEPTTWGLMMVGIGVMGASLRTRRRKHMTT